MEERDQDNLPGVTIYRNGVRVGDFVDVPERRVSSRHAKPQRDVVALVGPDLKVARAKRHLEELKAILATFWASHPHELFFEDDVQTGSKIVCIRVHKPLPPEAGVIAGDVVHSLRSALDQMVCAVIRAARKQVIRGNAFPISGTSKSFNEACFTKLKNVPVKANRFIRRLKPYSGGNNALWLLSELDNMDKHNDLIPIAVSRVRVQSKIGLPGVYIAPEGYLTIGGGPEGSIPFGTQWGFVTPKDAKRVELREGDNEIYRIRPEPAHFPQEVQVPIDVTFGKTKVTNDEALVPTLEDLVELVDRIIHIADGRLM